jgi:hypothetical protein
VTICRAADGHRLQIRCLAPEFVRNCLIFALKIQIAVLVD